MRDNQTVPQTQKSPPSSSFMRDWTQGSIIKNLLSIAWPVMINNVLNVLGPTVDMIWVGRLGSDDLAAVGVASMIVMLVNALLMGLFTGLRSMVSRHIGAKNMDAALHVARQGFVLSFVMGVILAIMGIFLDRWMLSLLGVAPEVIELGAGYMKLQFIGMIAMTTRFTADGIMQASGDTVNPMKLAIAFRIVHVALSPVLIFGLWIFPAMGIEGAAVTNVVSQSTGTALGLWILMSGRSRIRFNFRGFRFDPKIIWRLVSIGIPASIMGLQMQFGQLLLTRFVVPFGTIAVATHTLCQRIDMSISMPLMGLGMGAGVLVGQNLGAKQPERAEKSGWIALGLSEAVLVLIAIFIIVAPELIIQLFSSDPEMLSVADKYIMIAAVGYAVTSFTMVLQSCITSAGDTLPPMIISLVSVWVIQIPVAILLSKTSLGMYGVRWAIVGGAFLSAASYLVYFRMGHWKRKRI